MGPSRRSALRLPPSHRHQVELSPDAPRGTSARRTTPLQYALCLLTVAALVAFGLLFGHVASQRNSRSSSQPQVLLAPPAMQGHSQTVLNSPRHASLPEPLCATVSSIGRDACSPHRLLFVGGLQRSGTSTLAALLDTLPGTSGLHFDARERAHMEEAPWKRLVDVHTGRWMKWAYFKEVVSTGGAEGKLLQRVFPYRYAVWDAKFAKLPALLAHPSALSPLVTDASREQLWADWVRFWPSASATLVDKSPENILMAPFLQAMFGKSRPSFVFVMRHPLCWALVAAKWGCIWQPIGGDGGGDASGAAKAPTLECLSHLVDVWLAVHERLAAHLPALSDAVLLPAESDAWLESPEWLSRLVARGALTAAPSANASAEWTRTQRAFRETSHGYVHCFLRGFAPRRTRVPDGDCRVRGVAQAR